MSLKGVLFWEGEKKNLSALCSSKHFLICLKGFYNRRIKQLQLKASLATRHCHSCPDFVCLWSCCAMLFSHKAPFNFPRDQPQNSSSKCFWVDMIKKCLLTHFSPACSFLVLCPAFFFVLINMKGFITALEIFPYLYRVGKPRCWTLHTFLISKTIWCRVWGTFSPDRKRGTAFQSSSALSHQEL